MKYTLFLLSFLSLSAIGKELELNNSFIRAEIMVESSGRDNAVGDNRRAIGCLQIHRECWRDALKYNPSIGGAYCQCTNRIYSIKIMTSYLNRFALKAIKENNFEIQSRVWNGGAGYKENKWYWLRIKKQMGIK